MLKHNLFEGSDLPLEEREDAVSNLAESVEMNFLYTKILTEEELMQRRETKVNNDIELLKMEQELKEYIAEAKKDMEPIKTANSRLLTSVKTRVEDAAATAYLIKDEEARQMGYYNGAGELIFSRMLTPEERQGNLLSGSFVLAR